MACPPACTVTCSTRGSVTHSFNMNQPAHQLPQFHFRQRPADHIHPQGEHDRPARRLHAVHSRWQRSALGSEDAHDRLTGRILGVEADHPVPEGLSVQAGLLAARSRLISSSALAKAKSRQATRPSPSNRPRGGTCRRARCPTAGATPFAPRCVKDLIEERLVERRRDLFSELSVVFMDTTTLSFVGAGGATLGRRGHSKDHRPELMQMVLGVVIDADGRPVCTEMWPGNTADVSALLPIVDRLRTRFAIGRVCVVADRGMISQPTIAALEERGLEYVLGVRERTDSLVRQVVLEDTRPFTPALRAARQRGETQLWVKEVMVEGRRYVVCRNEAEANKDAADREAVLDGLERQLEKGDKALIGNSAYRRFLKAPPRRRSRSIPARSPMKPGSMASSSCAPTPRSRPLQAVLRYRDLLQVEDLFRTAKALLRTRPIYHSSDAAIRGHVFCSFLALVLRKELDDRCHAADFRPEWGDVLRDLDRLQEVELAKDGKRLMAARRVARRCPGAPVALRFS